MLLRFAATACHAVGVLDVACLLLTGNLLHLVSACAAFGVARGLRDVAADEREDAAEVTS